ncbi:MAG: methyltransferase domain-containing protein [bacterium]
MLPQTQSKEEFYRLFGPDAFSRADESDDSLFYSEDRFVEHLDSLALETVEQLIGQLIVEENPVILDLMAGWDSHIPPKITPAKVVGLGLNANELSRNSILTERVIHDLNGDARLPFEDKSFDVVLNTVSVDYMTRPLEVFREVGRILRPGGLFLVIFSNRMFPQKVIRLWRAASEEERLMYVEDLFHYSGCFHEPNTFVSKGKPRPAHDKYAHLGIPSDPIYAVYAERSGGRAKPSLRPKPTLVNTSLPEQGELQERMQSVQRTLRCPYCQEPLRKWAVPQNPFTEWDTDFMYVCFNDACPYLVRGWQVMGEQGNRGMSYRCMFNPVNNRCMPIPVPSLQALKDGILE